MNLVETRAVWNLFWDAQAPGCPSTRSKTRIERTAEVAWFQACPRVCHSIWKFDMSDMSWLYMIVMSKCHKSSRISWIQRRTVLHCCGFETFKQISCSETLMFIEKVGFGMSSMMWHCRFGSLPVFTGPSKNIRTDSYWFTFWCKPCDNMTLVLGCCLVERD